MLSKTPIYRARSLFPLRSPLPAPSQTKPDQTGTNLTQPRLQERGHFQGIFIADVLGGYDVYKGPRNLTPAIQSGAQWPVNEPLSVVPAMAAATKSIAFGKPDSTLPTRTALFRARHERQTTIRNMS